MLSLLGVLESWRYSETPKLPAAKATLRSLRSLRPEKLSCISCSLWLKSSVAPYSLIGVKRIEVRESTSPVSQSGKLVQRALAFITAHYAEPIRPLDVVRELKVSRRLADLRFSELQGESIGKAILHTRLEAVRRMLTATNDTLENIAAACGFRKVDRMRAAFKARYDVSPSEFRGGKR